jgi:hypothetical protein
MVEIARQLPPDCTNMSDPAAASYHALFALDCADALLEPGSAAAVGEATVVGQFDEEAAAYGVRRSALPVHSPSVG